MRRNSDTFLGYAGNIKTYVCCLCFGYPCAKERVAVTTLALRLFKTCDISLDCMVHSKKY
jgi:hypothetical protein